MSNLISIYFQRCLISTEGNEALSVRAKFPQEAWWFLYIYLIKKYDGNQGSVKRRLIYQGKIRENVCVESTDSVEGVSAIGGTKHLSSSKSGYNVL